MMFYSDNPGWDADRWMEHQERMLARRPKCCCCEEPIQEDTAYKIDGELWCQDCIDDCRVSVDDMEDDRE